MTRPDPTVTVPVEPTEAMLDAWHKATWPQGPRVSPLSQQGLSFARAYRAMLAAAPAAPQAAGVGDDYPRVEIDDLLTCCHRLETDKADFPNYADWPITIPAGHWRAIARHLRAPSREPEGGAVRQALADADDVSARIQKVGYRANLSDVECLRNHVRKLAALATREEAPAEAGERDYPAEFEAWWATYRHRNRDVADYPVKKQIAFDAFYFAALRAQPPARDNRICRICDGGPGNEGVCLCGEEAWEQPPASEDAQPGGWLRAVDEEMVCAHLGVAEAEDSYETAKKKLANLIQWNIAVAMDPSVGGRPAPDALRVAVEALEEISEVAHITRARLIARHALAALQAEHGAK